MRSSNDMGTTKIRADHTPRQVNWFVIVLWAVVGAVSIAAAVYWPVTRYHRYARKALGDNIRAIVLGHVESSSSITLVAPAEIAVFRDWLIHAAATGAPAQSADSADHLVEIILGDGRVEHLQISAIPAGINTAPIRIQWHGYTRFGDAPTLARLLHAHVTHVLPSTRPNNRSFIPNAVPVF